MATKKKSTKKKKLDQRDAFFKKHKYARVLLGIFIVSTAIMIGMMYHRYKLEVAIGEYLLNEGIDYKPGL